MSKRSVLGAALGLAALVSMPAASQAHCLSYKHFRSDVASAVDGTTTFVKHVADRTAKFGDRLFGWISCKHV
jgi:hypothetical protein